MDVEITVLITAYNRKKYLAEAVSSVLSSTLDRTKYEIIVVKNFVDSEIDLFLAQNKVVVLNTENVNIGKQIAYGLYQAKGQVISFLDDDDMFEKEKLSCILSEFKDPSLIYYHNLNSPISEDSSKMKGNVQLPILNELILLPDTVENLTKALSSRGDMTHYSVMFNLSCVSIRKEILLKQKTSLESLIDGTDHFVFYISLMENRKMKFGTKYLTLYRVHESASNLLSGEFNPKKIGPESIRLFLDPNHYSRVLDNVTRGTKVNPLVRCKLLEESLLLNILSFNGQKYFSAKNFFEYQHCLKVNSKYTIKNFSVRFFFVSLALTAPRLAGIGYLLYKYRNYKKRITLHSY
jgi:glycosyltransferase involved in cell wall biosynthesis